MLEQAADGLGRDFNSIAATEAVPALLVLLVLSVVAGVVVARQRTERSVLEWSFAFATVALIVAATLFRGEVSLGFHPGGLTSWAGSDLASLSRDPLSSSQFLLNVALFVPAGVAWTWMTGRSGRTLGALVLGSFVIECLRAITGAGGNDLVDIVANSIGALIGSGGVLIVMNITGGQLRELSRTRRLQLIAPAGAAVVLVFASGFVGAERRQDSVRSTVAERFGNTDLKTLQDELASDPEAVWGAVPGVRADYFTTDDSATLRFPATFFGLQRCVYATWTVDDIEIRDASGDDCTRFLG